jgi:signal transduction histidine kinase
LYPRGVRARLCLAFTLTAAVVGIGGSLLFVHVVRVGIANNLDNNLEARAQTIAGVLDSTAPPRLPDPLLDAGTRAVAQATAETFAVVRRPDGVILTATGAPPPQQLTVPSTLLQLQDGGLARTTIDIGGQAYRVAALAVKRSDGTWLALAGTSRRSNDEALQDLNKALFVALPVLVLLVAAGAWVLAGAALRPVERMRRDAAAHGGTGGERLAVPPTGDELARLAVTLNELLGRLGSSLARQQDLVADAGHELRTPLAVLRTELELASRPGRSQEELAEAVEHAAHEVNRLSQLAEDLLFLARADGSGPLVRPQPTDLAGVLHSAIRSARAHADLAGVTLSVDVAPELTAVIDASTVRRAVDNLLANAVEYAAGGPGQPQVRLSGAYGNDLHTLTIAVEDTGPGFPADFLPHAFDRFRRADPARTHHHGQRGAGLGLAVVREIAEAHGGRAEAGNLPSGGARVAMIIPQPIPARLVAARVDVHL